MAWSTLLTPAQRRAWDALALTVFSRWRAGQGPLSGQQLFVKLKAIGDWRLATPVAAVPPWAFVAWRGPLGIPLPPPGLCANPLWLLKPPGGSAGPGLVERCPGAMHKGEQP